MASVLIGIRRWQNEKPWRHASDRFFSLSRRTVEVLMLLHRYHHRSDHKTRSHCGGFCRVTLTGKTSHPAPLADYEKPHSLLASSICVANFQHKPNLSGVTGLKPLLAQPGHCLSEAISICACTPYAAPRRKLGNTQGICSCNTGNMRWRSSVMPSSARSRGKLPSSCCLAVSVSSRKNSPSGIGKN